MTNKQEKIKSLTWKYFWKQKKEEIFKFIKQIREVLILFVIVGLFTLAVLFYIVAMIVILFFVGCAIFLLIQSVYIWVSSNWKKAKSRAMSEINGKVKK